MEIIKQGTPWWAGKIASCPACFTEVKLDSTLTHQPQFILATPLYVHFACPVCTTKIQFDNEQPMQGKPGEIIPQP